MKEKIWRRNKDDTFSVRGNIEVSRVLLSYLRNGEWSTPYVDYKRKIAEKVIEDAIAKGQVTADAYRLTPVPGAEKLLEKKRKIFEEIRKKYGTKSKKEEGKYEKEKVVKEAKRRASVFQYIEWEE